MSRDAIRLRCSWAAHQRSLTLRMVLVDLDGTIHLRGRRLLCNWYPRRAAAPIELAP